MFPTAALRNSAAAAAQHATSNSSSFYIAGGAVAALFGAGGIYFGTRKTGVEPAKSSFPVTGDDVPSTLHSVVLPAVNLPKSLHEKYNKIGKEGY